MVLFSTVSHQEKWPEKDTRGHGLKGGRKKSKWKGIGANGHARYLPVNMGDHLLVEMEVWLERWAEESVAEGLPRS